MRVNVQPFRFAPAVFAAAFVILGGAGLTTLEAQKGKGGPQYALHVLGVPTGFAAATAWSINDAHEIVGAAYTSGGYSRALYWSGVDAGAVLLPCLAEPCTSTATAINASGVIAGSANGEAVLWRPSGASWVIEVLPRPGDDTWRATAGDLLDDGTAAGYYAQVEGIMYPNDVPLIWRAPGVTSELPVPGGFFSGRLGRINESGDAAGELRTNDGHDPTYVYGAIWINDGGGYLTIPLTALVNGITARAADGSFLVSSTEGRIRVWPSGGAWNYVVDANPGGPGTSINRLGDMTGFLPKKGSSNGGTPYLFTIDGSLIKLPLPNTYVGRAMAASTDRWVAGDLARSGTYPAAVWRPAN